MSVNQCDSESFEWAWQRERMAGFEKKDNIVKPWEDKKECMTLKGQTGLEGLRAFSRL